MEKSLILFWEFVPHRVWSGCVSDRVCYTQCKMAVFDKNNFFLTVWTKRSVRVWLRPCVQTRRHFDIFPRRLSSTILLSNLTIPRNNHIIKIDVLTEPPTRTEFFICSDMFRLTYLPGISRRSGREFSVFLTSPEKFAASISIPLFQRKARKIICLWWKYTFYRVFLTSGQPSKKRAEIVDHRCRHL